MGVCVHGNNRVTLTKVRVYLNPIIRKKVQYERLAPAVMLDDGPINIILLVPKQLRRTPLG